MSNNQQILLTLLFAFPCHDPSVTMASPSQSSSSHHQSSLPRLLQVTAGGNIRGDLLIGVPVSFLLPTIGFNTAYKKIRKRRPRMDNEIEDDGEKDPLLARLDFLFDVLDIDDLDCQQKVICEVVSNQEKFSPLSDLLISLFRKTRNKMMASSPDSSFRWDHYFYSSYIGQNSKDKNVCLKNFQNCAFNTSQLVNIPVIHLWQLASKYLSIRIDDN